MTTAETPDLSLDAALFMGALDPRSRELRLIEIVRAQRDKAIRLDPAPATQNLLHSARQVVIAKQAEHPAEPVERLDMRLQKRLLGAVRERHRERRPRMTRTHMKQVDPA